MGGGGVAWRGVPPPHTHTPRQPQRAKPKSTMKVYETLSVKGNKMMAIFNRMRLRTLWFGIHVVLLLRCRPAWLACRQVKHSSWHVGKLNILARCVGCILGCVQKEVYSYIYNLSCWLAYGSQIGGVPRCRSMIRVTLVVLYLRCFHKWRMAQLGSKRWTKKKWKKNNCVHKLGSWFFPLLVSYYCLFSIIIRPFKKKRKELSKKSS